MKQLLLKAIVCSVALLPVMASAAAPKPGKKFSFKVEERSSTQTSLGGNKTVPIPKGIPKFAIGQKVNFTIGSKKELKFAGISVPYKTDGGSAWVFTNVKKSNAASVQPITVQVFKDSSGNPTGVAMTFIKRSGVGTFNMKVVTVFYSLGEG
jgi:hypothetical protein